MFEDKPEWTEKNQVEPKKIQGWTKMEQDEPGWSMMNHNEQGWSKMNRNERGWIKKRVEPKRSGMIR